MSRGIPRLVNALSDRILMAAYLHQTREITLEVAQKAFEEMAFICAQSQGKEK
jgi:Holliday junction resolvasome RuvABC ATP-dependent DNA helicase subunit